MGRWCGEGGDADWNLIVTGHGLAGWRAGEMEWRVSMIWVRGVRPILTFLVEHLRIALRVNLQHLSPLTWGGNGTVLNTIICGK